MSCITSVNRPLMREEVLKWTKVLAVNQPDQITLSTRRCWWKVITFLLCTCLFANPLILAGKFPQSHRWGQEMKKNLSVRHRILQMSSFSVLDFFCDWKYSFEIQPEFLFPVQFRKCRSDLMSWDMELTSKLVKGSNLTADTWRNKPLTTTLAKEGVFMIADTLSLYRFMWKSAQEVS